MHNPSPERLRVLFEMQRASRWRVAASTAPERRAKLLRLKAAILERREALSEALYQDFRKPGFEVDLTEVHAVLEEINFAVRHLERWMRPQRVPTPVKMLGTRSEVRLEPKGNVLILSPWNYPFNLLFAPLVAAIAAGNCVIARPSEKVPHTAEVMAAMLGDAFDASEVALVTGEVETAQKLLELPFDHLFFTGSARVGQTVMEKAAQHLAGVTLELGGKSPALLLEDADVDEAARRIAYGKGVNAGQTCVAPDYALVPRSREAAFLAALGRHFEALYGPNPGPAHPDLAHLIDDGAAGRLAALLEDAREQGARTALGGRLEGRFLAPTVLAGVTPGMRVMQEEIFGPVLPVLGYGSLEEAIGFIASRPKPLALYAFGRNRAALEQTLRGTSAGNTVVNHIFFNMLNPNLPFGGVGESGLGGSYHGFYGFRTFSHERAVLHQGRSGLSGVFTPPYTSALKVAARRALRWLE